MRKFKNLFYMVMCLSIMPVDAYAHNYAAEGDFDSWECYDYIDYVETCTEDESPAIKTSQSQEFKIPVTRDYRNVKIKSVTSLSDLNGSYVMCYDTYYNSSTVTSSGNYVTIAAIDDTDSISITNVYETDAVVKAKVDLSTMTISIPSQTIGTDSSKGDYGISYYSTVDGVDRTSEITGTISSDGIITISSYWGVFYATNTNIIVYSSSYFEPINGIMSYDYYHYTKGEGTFNFGVVVTQESDSLLSIKNFFDIGVIVNVKLRTDSTAKIPNQYLYTNGSRKYTTHAVDYDSETGYISTYEPNIACYKATDARIVTWGPWAPMYTAVSTGSSTTSYPLYHPQNGKLETYFDITYPKASDLGLDGNGTVWFPDLG